MPRPFPSLKQERGDEESAQDDEQIDSDKASREKRVAPVPARSRDARRTCHVERATLGGRPSRGHTHSRAKGVVR